MARRDHRCDIAGSNPVCATAIFTGSRIYEVTRSGPEVSSTRAAPISGAESSDILSKGLRRTILCADCFGSAAETAAISHRTGYSRIPQPPNSNAGVGMVDRAMSAVRCDNCLRAAESYSLVFSTGVNRSIRTASDYSELGMRCRHNAHHRRPCIVATISYRSSRCNIDCRGDRDGRSFWADPPSSFGFD